MLSRLQGRTRIASPAAPRAVSIYSTRRLPGRHRGDRRSTLTPTWLKPNRTITNLKVLKAQLVPGRLVTPFSSGLVWTWSLPGLAYGATTSTTCTSVSLSVASFRAHYSPGVVVTCCKNRSSTKPSPRDSPRYSSSTF